MGAWLIGGSSGALIAAFSIGGPLVGLWPASSLGWLGLVSYSLLSGIGLYCCRNRLTRLAS